MTMSEPDGTTSFRRLRKSRDGGNKIPMLKTLGSTSSLCPVALPSRLELALLVVSWGTFELETRPGTEDFRMDSRLSRSSASSVDFASMSESLNMRLFLSRGAREYRLLPVDLPCPLLPPKSLSDAR